VANHFGGWYVDDIRVVADAVRCEHDLCAPGAPLQPTCDACAATVCGQDPFCCTTEWDRSCVTQAEQLCNLTCTPACAHDRCENGAPLAANCDPCVAQICRQDPYCCENSWDRQCVEAVETVCQETCVPACAHELCAAGAPLDAACDSCASSVCAADPYCCSTAWDDRCVQAAAQGCGLTCGCAHEICSEGGPLAPGCNACVETICAADPYCCSTAWDERCIAAANDGCGATCPVSSSVRSRLLR
jgi:hypothetical protein